MTGSMVVGQAAPVLEGNFLDPRLAVLYDRFNPGRDDVEFYVRLAGAPSRSILDIGCGTGVLALPLAAAGHQVTGVDPARPMLDVARANDVDGLVEWIEGDIGSLPDDQRFDLAVMTGHVFQVFLDDADVATILGQTRSHLRPGGTLAFETRNPAVRPWESWVPSRSRRAITDESGSTIVSRHQLLDVTGELVTFETTYDFVGTGETLRSRSTLRFAGPQVLLDQLDTAGFGPVILYGNWDRSPFTDSSPEIIAIAEVPS